MTTVLRLSVGQVSLPGTQPETLQFPPEPSTSCSCHDSYTADAFSEPGQSYKATMMALSGRDPLFRAAFEVARQDAPELTELCLRCHTPAAWLAGRSKGELDALTIEDLQGITCDICHRMEATDPPLIGDGQITLSPDTAKRSQRGNPPFNGHGVIRDDYTTSALMCATCHSLFNPQEVAHDADGNALGLPYYEQRTFEEWRDSALPGKGQTCISCHMTVTRGAAVRGGEVYDDLPVHNFVGGNDFAPRAVRVLNPNLNIALELGEVSRWVEQSLASAAEIEILSAPATVSAQTPFVVDVRLTNKTGHKLPTGYPEGRRVYLEVSLQFEGAGAPVILSGAWDSATGNLLPDDQLRTYETEHGRVENGRSIRTRRLLLMNQILKDTRIPPEGFTPQHPDMVPSGRDYGRPPYRHYDEHRYQLVTPAVTAPTRATLTVRAMFQTTDGAVVDFLVDAAMGTDPSAELFRAWEALDHAPPKEMVRASVDLTVTPQGMVASDAGIVDTGALAGSAASSSDGCRCVTSTDGASGAMGLMLGWFTVASLWLVGFVRRRR